MVVGVVVEVVVGFEVWGVWVVGLEGLGKCSDEGLVG